MDTRISRFYVDDVVMFYMILAGVPKSIPLHTIKFKW